MKNNSAPEIKSLVEEFAAKQPWNHNFNLPFDIETRPGDLDPQQKI